MDMSGERRLTLGQVLLVGEDEDDGVPHLAVVDDPVQLLPRLVYAVAVGAVHHEDEPLRPRVVVPPQRTDLVLAPDVLQLSVRWRVLCNVMMAKDGRKAYVNV